MESKILSPMNISDPLSSNAILLHPLNIINTSNQCSKLIQKTQKTIFQVINSFGSIRHTSSLLLAAHLLCTRTPSHLLLFLLESSSRVRVLLTFSEVFQNLVFVGFAVTFGFNGLAIEDGGDLFSEGWGNRVFLGVSDEEFDVEVSMGHGILVEGKTQSLSSLEFFMIENLSRCCGNRVLFAVQMLDFHSDTGQCFKKRDLLHDDQVCSSTLENRVSFDLDANVDVTCNDAGLNRKIITYSSFSPVKMQSCSSGQPVSMATSKVRSTLTTFFPLQTLQRSSSFMVSPKPRQSPHSPDDWVYIPGPSCTKRVTIPTPLHLVHFTTLTPPFPSQGSQMRSLVILTVFMAPLQMSSRVTSSSINLALPFFGPDGLRPPRVNISKRPPMPPPPGGPPFLTPSSPQSSQSCLFSGLERTSQAAVTSLNFSGSPPLSGCSLSAFFRNALRISSVVAFLSTPSNQQYLLVSTSLVQAGDSSSPPKPPKPLNPPPNI